MPPSSQPGRPRLKKESSSSSQQSNNRNIRDFFKPYTIPRTRIPANDVEEDEIVVASPRKSSVTEESRNVAGIDFTASSPSKKPKRVGRPKRQGFSKSSSPTKGRGSRAKDEHKGVLQLDGAGDSDDLLHESPPSSQHRVVAAVEVPTATKVRSPAPLAMTGTNVNANVNNMSFNSTSSLTSVPLSSQASSSRRIFKNGIPAVTNSDSGSAEDSEDELPDIFIPRKKLRMTPPEEKETIPREVAGTVKPTARHSDRLSTGKESQGSSRSHTPRSRRSPSPPRPASTSALLKLVRDKERRERADTKIREAEAAFETEQKLRDEKLQRERDLGGGLKALVADDSDEGERMMLAVERTEAMGAEVEEFFYFHGVRNDVTVKGPSTDDVAAFVPWAGVQFGRLKAILLDAQQSELAVLSGFLAEAAGRSGLPPEAMQWMFSQLVLETREEVCEGYVEVVRRGFLHEGRNQADLEKNWCCLSQVYRVADALANTEEVLRLHRNEGVETTAGSAPPGLRHVVRAVQAVCENAGHNNVPDKIFLELALASIDTHVSRDFELKAQVQDSMAAIIESPPPSGMSKIACTMMRGTTNLSIPLRCRIIANLPAFSERCHKLRRTLALYFISSISIPGTDDAMRWPDFSEWASLILERLQHAPEWSISEATNYIHLNALIPILNIAIDAGFSISPTTSSSTKSQSTKPQSLLAQKPTQSSEEKAFNAQIDSLTDTLRHLSARIRDAGTSHLRRTEAKSALERVVVRLEHCVRTRPRPKKGVFGSREAKGFMDGFLRKQGEDLIADRRDPEDRVSVVQDDDLSDRSGDSDDGDEGEAVGGAEND